MAVRLSLRFCFVDGEVKDEREEEEKEKEGSRMGKWDWMFST